MNETVLLDLLSTCVFGAVCFYGGYKYHQYLLASEMADMLANMLMKLEGKSMAQLSDDKLMENLAAGPVHELTHEFQNNIHYFYFSDSGQFAGQGPTLEDAATHFKELSKGEGIGIFKLSDSTDEFAFINGEVHEAAIKKIKL